MIATNSVMGIEGAEKCSYSDSLYLKLRRFLSAFLLCSKAFYTSLEAFLFWDSYMVDEIF